MRIGNSVLTKSGRTYQKGNGNKLAPLHCGLPLGFRVWVSAVIGLMSLDLLPQPNERAATVNCRILSIALHFGTASLMIARSTFEFLPARPNVFLDSLKAENYWFIAGLACPRWRRCGLAPWQQELSLMRSPFRAAPGVRQSKPFL